MKQESRPNTFSIAKLIYPSSGTKQKDLFFDTINHKIMMKCPFCNYKTSKTFNYDRHTKRYKKNHHQI